MAKVYVTAAESNQLASESEIKLRHFRRAGTRQVWDKTAEAWGVYDDSEGVSDTDALSDAVAINGYKEFEVELPALVHAADILTQFCKSDGTCLFSLCKDAGELHYYNPGMLPINNKNEVKVH